MTIELPATVERELRDLALIQSRDVGEIVEEAVRQYLEASAITDLDASEIAEAQAKLIGELQDIPEWKDGREDDPEGRLARLERQGLLRRSSAPLPREVLMAEPPTTEWYQSIGFTVLGTHEEDGVMDWAMLSFGEGTVMFSEGGRPSTAHRREIDLYVQTEGVDDLYQQLSGRVEVVEGPHDTFYGMREIIIRDLNRFWITFGQEIEKPK